MIFSDKRSAKRSPTEIGQQGVQSRKNAVKYPACSEHCPDGVLRGFDLMSVSLWLRCTGTGCCDDVIAGGPPPPTYDDPTAVPQSPRTPLMRKYRFVVAPPGVALDDSGGDVPPSAAISGPRHHMYESPLLREPIPDMTSFDVGSHNMASVSS